MEAVRLSEVIEHSCDDSTVNIGIFLLNSIHYAIAYFSVLFHKNVIVPIGVKEKKTEVISVSKYCELDIIISDTEHIPVLTEMFADYENRITFINMETRESIVLYPNKELIKKSKIELITDTEDCVAIMLHTSGTTSQPKRVMLTHKSLLSNIQSNIASLKLDEKDNTLITLPMHFGYCNTAQFLTHVYLGAGIVIMDDLFMPKKFFTLVEKEQITNFTSVPTLLFTLLQYRYSDSYDISRLRYICFGGGVIKADVIKKLIEKFPTVGFVQTYGQTECSPRVTALLPEFSLEKAGSVGKPIPGVEVKIVDDGMEVENGTVGQILVRGFNIMKGYYKREDLTAQTIRNGWVYTGDLGYFDEEGFLYINGRIKNMIISGGINIYPEEIEEILCEYPAIKEALVYGQEDEFMGEIPIAKIVVEQELDREDLEAFCFEHLASYKVPKQFCVVEALDKTYNGKLKRGEKNGYQ